LRKSLLKAETLSITIDGITNQTYNYTRPETDVNKIIANLAKVIKLRNSLNSKKPEITGKMNIFSFNIHEVKDFIRKCIEIGIDKVFLAKGQGPEQYMNCSLKKEDFEIFDNKIPIKIENSLLNDYDCSSLIDNILSDNDFLKLKKDPIRLFEILLCPKSAMTIQADGSVAPCCYDIFHRIPIGNIKTGNFDSLFKESNIKKLCRRIISGMYKGDFGLPCYNCPIMLNITKQGKRNIYYYKAKYKIKHILKKT